VVRHAGGAQQPRGDRADPGLGQPRAGGGEEAGLQEAVRVEQQDRVRRRVQRGDPEVDGGGVGDPRVQPQDPRAVAAGELGRGVRARVVDHEDLRALLGRRGGQRALQQVRLVDRQQQDRGRHAARSAAASA